MAIGIDLTLLERNLREVLSDMGTDELEVVVRTIAHEAYQRDMPFADELLSASARFSRWTSEER